MSISCQLRAWCELFLHNWKVSDRNSCPHKVPRRDGIGVDSRQSSRVAYLLILLFSFDFKSYFTAMRVGL